MLKRLRAVLLILLLAALAGSATAGGPVLWPNGETFAAPAPAADRPVEATVLGAD